MTKNKLKCLVTLGTLISLIGVILVFFSVSFGISIAGHWLESKMIIDASTYMYTIKKYSRFFSVLGFSLCVIGFVTIVFAEHKTHTFNNRTTN